VSDCRDFALENAAFDHIDLLERLRDVEADRAVYREMAQAALHALHKITQERNALRERLHRLLADLRKLRTMERRAA
jgi:hypothetical protein